MKIKEPTPPPQNWWVGGVSKCKCWIEIELEESDKLKTELGNYGWFVAYKCPSCKSNMSLFFDIESGKRGMIKTENRVKEHLHDCAKA